MPGLRLKYAVTSRGVQRGVAGLLGKADERAHLYECWPWELRRLLTVSGFHIRSLRFRVPNRYVPWEPLAAGIGSTASRVWASSGRVRRDRWVRF